MSSALAPCGIAIVDGEGGGERVQPIRLKGPAIATIKLEAEIDATDSPEHSDQNANAVQYGIEQQLAALERPVSPTSAELLGLNAQSQSGTRKILPPEAPLIPIRAKVSLGLRMMTTGDLGFDDCGGSIFICHPRTREVLVGRTGAANGSDMVSYSDCIPRCTRHDPRIRLRP